MLEAEPTLQVQWASHGSTEAMGRRASGSPVEVLPDPLVSDASQCQVRIHYFPLGICLIKVLHEHGSVRHTHGGPVGSLRFRCMEPTLVIQSVRGGPIDCQEFAATGYPLDEDHQSFHHAVAREFRQRIYSRQSFEMIIVCFCLSKFEKIIGEIPSLSILERLGVGSPDSHRQWCLPTYLGTPLHASFTSALTGSAQTLHCQAKVMEYLSLLSNFLNPGNQPIHSADVLQPMAAIHDYLSRAEGLPPPLTDLARQFRISVRRLQMEFKRTYGMTIRSFLKGLRMERARAAILGSDIPLKALADRLGYTHVNNFNLAFHKHFGYPPGSLRRGRD